jgi:Ca2+-binding EF-hand superfamily protein
MPHFFMEREDTEVSSNMVEGRKLEGELSDCFQIYDDTSNEWIDEELIYVYDEACMQEESRDESLLSSPAVT